MALAERIDDDVPEEREGEGEALRCGCFVLNGEVVRWCLSHWPDDEPEMNR